MSSRIEEIIAFIELAKDDPFPRYGLAMEYKNLGLFKEAHEAFLSLRRLFPQYVPQYLMYGHFLVQMKEMAQARACLERGLLEAERAKNEHARSEIAQALQQMEFSDDE